MKVLYLILAVGALLAVNSCKKTTTTTDNSGIAGKSKQEIFMMQKWKLARIQDSNTVHDQELVDPCDLDDSYNFNSKTNYLLDRGACTNGAPKTENLPWSMTSSNADKVTIYGLEFTILTQTATSFSIWRQYINGGYPTRQTYTYGKF